jgi:hypothetical protein
MKGGLADRGPTTSPNYLKNGRSCSEIRTRPLITNTPRAYTYDQARLSVLNPENLRIIPHIILVLAYSEQATKHKEISNETFSDYPLGHRHPRHRLRGSRAGSCLLSLRGLPVTHRIRWSDTIEPRRYRNRGSLSLHIQVCCRCSLLAAGGTPDFAPHPLAISGVASLLHFPDSYCRCVAAPLHHLASIHSRLALGTSRGHHPQYRGGYGRRN